MLNLLWQRRKLLRDLPLLLLLLHRTQTLRGGREIVGGAKLKSHCWVVHLAAYHFHTFGLTSPSTPTVLFARMLSSKHLPTDGRSH